MLKCIKEEIRFSHYNWEIKKLVNEKIKIHKYIINKLIFKRWNFVTILFLIGKGNYQIKFPYEKKIATI